MREWTRQSYPNQTGEPCGNSVIPGQSEGERTSLGFTVQSCITWSGKFLRDKGVWLCASPQNTIELVFWCFNFHNSNKTLYRPNMGEVFRDMQFLLAQQQHFMSKPVRPNNQPLTLTQVHKKITSFITLERFG